MNVDHQEGYDWPAAPYQQDAKKNSTDFIFINLADLSFIDLMKRISGRKQFSCFSVLCRLSRLKRIFV